jgi:hypothetical protein
MRRGGQRKSKRVKDNSIKMDEERRSKRIEESEGHIPLD